MFLRMAEMTERSGLSRWTLMKELQDGNLHGVHTKKYGTWRVYESCFDAWLLGFSCEHRAEGVA